MFKIKDITNTREIYEYQMKLSFPYKYDVTYENWESSFLNDIDGDGRKLFRSLHGKVAYDDDNAVVGFIQFGRSAFGFDETGEISSEVSYPMIRVVYFDANRKDAGSLLLQEALDVFG